MENQKILSLEWFKLKASEDKYKNIDAEANKIYEEFQNEYSIEKIKSLSGEEILNKICYGKNEDSLCYKLERAHKLKIFGGISGQAAPSLYGLYFNKTDNTWRDSKRSISELEAISTAKEICNKLILGAEIIKDYGEIKNYNDYLNIFQKFEKNDLKDYKKMWKLKYYHMLFPNVFPTFYSDFWHIHILFNLGMKIKQEERFLRMGKIACFVKDCNISNIVFSQIITDYIGEPKKFFRIGTGDNNFDSWKSNNYVAIGWNEMGNLSTFFVDNKEKNIKQKISLKLKEIWDKDKATITKKTEEIYNFYTTKQNDTYIVAMKGKKLLGLGLLRGNYFFDDNNKNINKYAHCRNIEWLTFPNNFQIGERKLTTFCELKNIDNICQLYNLMHSNNINGRVEMNNKTNQPLNQILYGPPGTGKTYNTIIKAMEIIDSTKIEYDENNNVKNYKQLKEEFDELKQSGQIEFITFHQSYSYEEFIEGIKPNLNNSNLSYYKSEGIFKKICRNASKNLYKQKNNEKIQAVSFEDVLECFKEKYPEGSNFENLLNISYEGDNLIYHFGKQDQDRKIDLSKIKKILSLNKKYKTAIDFNKEYNGNSALKGYYHNFYKELLNIKNTLEDENQISIENNKEYIVDEKAPRYVLIIDEINRGNISKIFGELITLIEPDKRKGTPYELKVSLTYSPNDELFSVPKNLYIIGTMNTSDRSIASVDIALRRRFKFIEMMPQNELVANFEIDFDKIFESLNNKIKILLDRDHQIGHSYFIKTKYNDANRNNNIETLKNIWFDEILPLLNEYFYNDWDKLQALLGEASKNNDSFVTIKETKLPFYKYDIEDKVYDFIDKTNMDNDNFKLALSKISEEKKQEPKEKIDE